MLIPQAHSFQPACVNSSEVMLVQSQRSLWAETSPQPSTAHQHEWNHGYKTTQINFISSLVPQPKEFMERFQLNIN